MVERLAGAGAQVSVFARRPDVRQRLSAVGARAVSEVSEVGPGSDVVISCLYSDDQLLAVADEIVPRLDRGAVLVSHTTGSPAVVNALAITARQRGADVVDAAFSGTAEDVLAGKLTVMLGGRAASIGRCEPFLRSYAGTVIRTGELGSAMLLKLVNNVVFAANVQLTMEVARLAGELGVPLDDVLAVLRHSSGGTKVLDYLSAVGDLTAFIQDVQPFLVKDVAVCEQVATSMKVDLGLLGSVVRGGAMALAIS
jgi:3-hydroxyisobutyrate dehydrogenase-like beta-hydroxyacid dehydrogenase